MEIPSETNIISCQFEMKCFLSWGISRNNMNNAKGSIENQVQ